MTADIKNMLFWSVFQNDIHKPAQIAYVEKLKLHAAIFRRVKFSVMQSAADQNNINPATRAADSAMRMQW